MENSKPHLSGALTVTLLAACVISLLSFGVRSAFGLFTDPLTRELGISREVYSIAIAIQNFGWGIAQPLAGFAADRFGARRVMVAGAALYARGIAGMLFAASPLQIYLTAGVLTGVGMGGASYITALAALGRAMLVRGDKPAKSQQPGHSVAGAAILRTALRHPSYVLLVLGFFVCGFQLAFITTHFPAYLGDRGMPAAVASWAIGLVGLFNVIGSYVAGVWGARRSKKNLLSALYFARALVIALFILAPITPPGVLLFGAAMGLLWLATVPLTSGLVATFIGTRYMATLFGVVFFSHQVGSFLGVYLGGYLFEGTGSYDIVWWCCVGLSVLAAVVNLPIREAKSQPFSRLAAA